MKKNIHETAVFCLGGLGEVGKNTYCIEHNDQIIIIDAGVKFAGDALPGIDYVIPDYTYLVENQRKIAALFITHGHEDHIGGIAFMLQKMNIPVVYAPRLAVGLIRKKTDERKISSKLKVVEYNNDTIVQYGDMKISFFAQSHSIPDAYGIVIETPNGTIVTTGDYKFDLTPVGHKPDIQKMAAIGKKGVTLLLSDSTNAEVEQFTMSEKKVSDSLRDVFKKTKGRLIVATFASNVGRVEQIIEAAIKYDRKIVVFGRSMENVIDISRKYGIIKASNSVFVKPDAANKIPNDKLLILCTGSQGEPLAALSRIANNNHKHIKIMEGDTVVFSSSPIPGNSLMINKVVNNLFKRGANVITNTVLNSIHTSGHASQEEQKLMFHLMTPKYFFPIHGEHRMLKVHARTAMEIGIPKENCFILSNGDALVLNKGEVRLGGRVHADDIYVDGNDSSGLSTKVIRDREHLGNSGLFAVLITIDSKTNTILGKPQIITRGFIFMKENTEIIKEAQEIAYQAVLDVMKEKTTFLGIKNALKNSLSPFLFQKTQRTPIIVPLIMNKKQ